MPIRHGWAPAMDLREVRTFVTVADLGTVSRAAQHLHITQPALSRQIANLEDELGLRLFDRVGRRLLLTSAGAQLLKECRGLLSYSRAPPEHAEGRWSGGVETLRVSAAPPPRAARGLRMPRRSATCCPGMPNGSFP